MKINIYYGGRGVIDDPTLYVIDKIESVLIELKVDVKRYNIYEQKNAVSTLPHTLSGADGIILATTVEWLGIGGNMTTFLDACWLYANKEEISGTYMMPVVISTTYGEREALLTLESAWEILGGLPCSGLSGYVEDMAQFEGNADYLQVIEKKAEYLYRTISSRFKELPNSNKAVSKTIQRTTSLPLTPAESEQLSEYVADESYVAQQKQDILELSSLYRDLLGEDGNDISKEYIAPFMSHFIGADPELKVTYQFDIEGKKQPLLVMVDGQNIRCEYGETQDPDVLAKLSPDTMDEIQAGRRTFYKAFSVGEMAARGPLTLLRKLDSMFIFTK